MIAFAKKYIAFKLVFLLICCGALTVQAQDASKFPLIPYPSYLVAGKGSFIISSKTNIVTAKEFTNEAGELNKLMLKALGKRLLIVKSDKPQSIKLVYDAALTAPEAYKLNISKSQLTIAAKDPAGVFHAIETIRQLLPISIEQGAISSRLVLPAVTIEDQPAYAWRGMHLDVSRHFFSVVYLKKFIDRMALYKMNKLHLHLTDDQGWRI